MIRDLFNGSILLEAGKFEEIHGVRIIPDSKIGAIFFDWDDFEKYDYSGARHRKGAIKKYEIEQVQDEYGVDISSYKKSNFPFMFDTKDESQTKAKFIESNEYFDVYKVKGTPAKYIYVFFPNDGAAFLVHQDDTDKLEAVLELRDQKIYHDSDIFKAVGW